MSALRRFALLLPACIALLGLAAVASPIKYNITLNSTGGQTITGNLTYDSVTQTMGAFSFDINVHDEFGQGFADTPVTIDNADGYWTPVGNPLDFSFVNASSPYSQLTFYFTSLPGTTLNGGFSQFFLQLNPGEAGVNLVSGSAVVATPEPATWALCGTGLFLLLGLAYYERRHAAGLA